MPIYEYCCSDCGHELEAIQKFSDPPLTACPACGQDGLQKKISAAAFRLKGGGWYETDFKKDKRRNVVADADTGAKGDAKPSAEAAKGDAAKAPAAAGDSKPKTAASAGGSSSSNA